MILLNGTRVNREAIPAHCEFSDKVQRHARTVLRRALKDCAGWDTDNLDADVIVEQVWNAMTGLDKAEKKSRR